VDVRVEEQVLAPRVKDPREADLRAEVLVVPGDGEQGLGRGGEDDVEEGLLVPERERIEVVGDALVPTRVTLLHVTAERGRATFRDVFQHRLLGRRRMVSTPVIVGVRAHHVGDLEARPAFGGHDVRPGSAERLGGRSPQKIERAVDPADMLHADVRVDLGGANRPVTE
jgi:hypothetical protein